MVSLDANCARSGNCNGISNNLSIYWAREYKMKLIGNAVCSISRMLAISVLKSERVDIPDNLKVRKNPNLKGIPNLNTYKTKYSIAL